jgi:RNA polymerase sigma factor (sigma-70 family)
MNNALHLLDEELDEATAPAAAELAMPHGLSESERLTYARIPAHVDYIPSDLFDLPTAEQQFFGSEADDIEIPLWTTFPEVAEDIKPARKGRRNRLSAREESQLFLRYNYARHRLAGLAAEQFRRATLGRAKEMVVWYEKAMKARADLVRANLALVLAMAKRARIPNVDFGEIVSEGNMALLRAVEKFDAGRGFKFSTYGCRAILKSFNRLATKTGQYHQRFPAEYDPAMEKSDYDVKHHEFQQADTIETVREILMLNRAALTDVERTVVMERFAINTDERRKTLAEVGKMVGLTNERIRQIQGCALGKIRKALTEEFAGHRCA